MEYRRSEKSDGWSVKHLSCHEIDTFFPAKVLWQREKDFPSPDTDLQFI